ncbi:hypothetical protein DPMN_046104 [Dreissena polymorpha]|uniref:Uncharacterized protein n=1 Tax=Dreissena polymorpha TaxID=45954 RepID=A0A9D4D7A4_DREPO|nr:hypothetical protein DPMN_046104 [Dreissena polymorpha]
MGRWFEERKFYAEFQAGVTCSFAEYTLQGDGTVKVNNTGYREMYFHPTFFCKFRHYV